MSGPATDAGDAEVGDGHQVASPVVEVSAGRRAEVAGLPVQRALPSRPRRTVGAWCFADLMGPTPAGGLPGGGIGPHPHTGLHTVTWLFSGQVLHRDSLGTEQLIQPGQLNLMTAGHGVAHAEEDVAGPPGTLHGIQLWVAQPEGTRHGPPAFEHHARLPVVELHGATATVLVGELGGVASPARRDTDLVGAELALGGPRVVVPVDPTYEHALVVVEGEVVVEGRTAGPGDLAYLGAGRGALALDVAGPARAVLLGGAPFGEELVMWWNFVARTRDEVSESRRAWTAGEDRFGPVASALPRFEVDPAPWERGG